MDSGEPTAPPPSRADVTRLLLRASDGQRDALNDLFPLVYDQLRRLAQNAFRGTRKDSTLQPTALIHEAFVRLVEYENLRIADRAHFLALSARIMRQILADHARQHLAAKRGGNQQRVELTGAAVEDSWSGVDLTDLDDLLTKLSDLNARHAQILELRIFSGMTVEESAHALGVSEATVKNDWRIASAWLRAQLRDRSGS